MGEYVILDWDSEFFGFRVGRILRDKLKFQELKEALRYLKQGGVSLVYWASDPDDMESQKAARSCNGFLVDRKMTFATDREEMRKRSFASVSNVIVEEYSDAVPTSEMENLAVRAGMHSRFRVDPRIPEGRFVDLYKLWIRNSVSKKIADAVLVVQNTGKIVGMVTVGEKADCAQIGLICVDASVMEVMQLGLSLLRAAEKWALEKGFNAMQVITQENNIAACRFYKKSGYRIDKIENFYHFWV